MTVSQCHILNHTQPGILHMVELTELTFLAVGLLFKTTGIHIGTSRLQTVRLIGCLTGWVH